MCEGMFTLATSAIRADVTRYDDGYAYWWANFIATCSAQLCVLTTASYASALDPIASER